jgi:hypothetical protein
LNNAINEVVEPARYSPHTSLGIGVIADIARRVPMTGVTCRKLTRCRIENCVEQVGALREAWCRGLRRYEGLPRSKLHQSGHRDGQVAAQIASTRLSGARQSPLQMLGKLGLAPQRPLSVKFQEVGRHSPHGAGALSWGFAEK